MLIDTPDGPNHAKQELGFDRPFEYLFAILSSTNGTKAILQNEELNRRLLPNKCWHAHPF